MEKIINWIKDQYINYKKEIFILLIGIGIGAGFTWVLFSSHTTELKNTVKQLTNKLTAITYELNQSKDTNARLSALNIQLTADLGTATEVNSRSLREIQQLKSDLSTTKRRLSESILVSRDLEEKIRRSTERITELEQRVITFQAEFGETVNQLQSYFARIEYLERTISADNITIEQLQGEITEYIRRITNLEDILKSISGTSASIDEAIRRITTGFDSISSESSDLGKLLERILFFTSQGIEELKRIEELNKHIRSKFE